LGESFKQVSERLEMVHQGLGHMRELAADVGNLQKVLTNVKARGTWGEVQLGALLEEILSPEQYLKMSGSMKTAAILWNLPLSFPGRVTRPTIAC